MDDLANNLGISKKTLYEQFSSKNELVEATLDYALEMSCYQIDKFVSGKGSVIENVFRNQKEVEKAISIANDSLKSESFRDFLIKHSEAGFNMSSQKGDPKSREFKNLKKALEGINNDRN